MRKNPQVLLKHILESINWIDKDIEELSKEKYLSNVPVQDAILRRLEIIGEAVRNLPSDLKKENSGIPWQDIADMRNKLIHEYFDVDLELVWEVIQNELPLLKNKVKQILGES